MKNDALAYVNIKTKTHTPNEISKQSLFTVVDTGLYNCEPNYKTIRDHDDSYMIACVLTGEAILEYRGKTHYLKEGQMYFIDCHHKPHKYYTGSTGVWEKLWFHFNTKSLSPLYEFFYNSNGGPVIDTNPKIIDIIMKIMDASADTNIADDVKFSGMITEIIYLILTSKNSNNTAAISNGINREEIFEMVIKYIKANYSQKITLTDIAEHVHLNPSYLSRIFKKYTGLSPYAYLVRYRIIMAKQALMDTEQEISTIALNCGFLSVSRFCKLFREFENMPPKQFRLRNRNIL